MPYEKMPVASCCRHNMCEQLSEHQQSCSSISQLLMWSFGVVVLYVAC